MNAVRGATASVAATTGTATDPSDAFRRRFVEAVRAGGAVGRLGSQRGQRHAEQQQGDGDVAVADAPIHRKHHKVERVGNLADVLQFAKITLLFCQRID